MAANPRAAAVAALVRQEQDGFSNLVLDAELRRQKLEGRDKAFAGAIFYTVLEHQGTLDFILEQFLPKGLARLDPQVREILRAALAQARYMQVPVSAAVNEAVKLTRTFKKASASGLVNAVLRKACNYDLETARFRNETQRLMVLGSAGQDVAEFLRTHYPEEALGILTHTADGGCTSLRANCLKMDAAALCEKLLESGVKSAQPGLVPGSVLAKHADEAGAWLHGGKVFRYSDETAEAVASGEKLLKESQTVYESFADMMSPDDATKYLDFLENGSKEGLTSAELAGVEKADALLVSQKVEYEDVWDLRNAGDVLESGSKGGLDTIIKNGKVSIDDIKTNPSAFSGKSAEEIADIIAQVQ